MRNPCSSLRRAPERMARAPAQDKLSRPSGADGSDFIRGSRRALFVGYGQAIEEHCFLTGAPPVPHDEVHAVDVRLRKAVRSEPDCCAFQRTLLREYRKMGALDKRAFDQKDKKALPRSWDPAVRTAPKQNADTRTTPTRSPRRVRGRTPTSPLTRPAIPVSLSGLPALAHTPATTAATGIQPRRAPSVDEVAGAGEAPLRAR